MALDSLSTLIHSGSNTQVGLMAKHRDPKEEELLGSPRH